MEGTSHVVCGDRQHFMHKYVVQTCTNRLSGGISYNSVCGIQAFPSNWSILIERLASGARQFRIAKAGHLKHTELVARLGTCHLERGWGLPRWRLTNMIKDPRGESYLKLVI